MKGERVMLIESTDVSDFRYDPDLKEARAVVALTARDRAITLFCHTDVPDGSDAIHLLVEDALRQLRRMPEFRRTPDSVELATAYAPPADSLAA